MDRLSDEIFVAERGYETCVGRLGCEDVSTLEDTSTLLATRWRGGLGAISQPTCCDRNLLDREATA